MNLSSLKSGAFDYFLLLFSIFFQNYLSYLKIKEAAETLEMVYFLLRYETFWMVCLGQGCYPKAMHKTVWYLKGFLVYRNISQITNTPGPEIHEGRESKWWI